MESTWTMLNEKWWQSGAARGRDQPGQALAVPQQAKNTGAVTGGNCEALQLEALPPAVTVPRRSAGLMRLIQQPANSKIPQDMFRQSASI